MKEKNNLEQRSRSRERSRTRREGEGKDGNEEERTHSETAQAAHQPKADYHKSSQKVQSNREFGSLRYLRLGIDRIRLLGLGRLSVGGVSLGCKMEGMGGVGWGMRVCRWETGVEGR